MKRLIKTSMLLMVAALFAACASEDIAQDKKKENGTEAPKGGVIFAANGPKTSAKRLSIDGEEETADAKTRTNIKHTPGNGADAYWTSDDFIWVKDKNGTWQKSTGTTLHDGGTSAEFTLPGNKTDYADGCEVRYTGTKAYYSGLLSASSVFIPYQQSRTVANDFSKAGEWGDCGSGKAYNTGNPTKFNFTLEHKPAYLCFLPRCTNATVAPNIQLKGIKITATNTMSGGFMGDQFAFDGDNVSSSGGSPFGQNYIDVTLPGFPLSTTENQATNAIYLVVPPDTYDFKIEYTCKIISKNVEGTITKTFTNKQLEKGLIYDITDDLIPEYVSPKDFKYYMWDAQQDYWHGYESEQPIINRYAWGPQGQHYPKDNSDSQYRWYNETFPGNGVRNDAQTTLFKSLPNVNELLWYVKRGNPYWDTSTQLIVLNGRLRMSNIGGVWLKKKAAILRDNSDITENRFSNAYPDDGGTDRDWRTEAVASFPNSPFAIITNRGTPANTDDYFFLPALGMYDSGWLYDYKKDGGYWSSSAIPMANNSAYSLYHREHAIGVQTSGRHVAYVAQPFE